MPRGDKSKYTDKASAQQLKDTLGGRLGETHTHVQRLEKVFQMLGEAPKGTTCPAIDAIIKEAKNIAGDIDDQSVPDAALVTAAQAVEHYEINRYGTLITWSDEMGRTECAEVLKQIIIEEKALVTGCRMRRLPNW